MTANEGSPATDSEDRRW